MLDVLLLQLDMCCNGKIYHGFCLGWCLVAQIDIQVIKDGDGLEFVVPMEAMDAVNFHTPMAAMCRCMRSHARSKGLQASACWV